MIGNVAPSVKSSETTLNTLRYADRVKELKQGGNKTKWRKKLMLTREKNKNTVIEYEVKIDEDDNSFEEY